MEYLEDLLILVTRAAILIFECIGVGVITFSGLQGIVNYIRRKPNTRLLLAKGLSMGLEFKLGGEILRTVIIRDMSEIIMVGAIIILRTILAVLIHWEIKNEEEEYELSHQREEEKEGPEDSQS